MIEMKLNKWQVDCTLKGTCPVLLAELTCGVSSALDTIFEGYPKDLEEMLLKSFFENILRERKYGADEEPWTATGEED